MKLLIDENLSPRLARWAELQWNRLQTALAFADQACDGDLINRVLEVQQGGDCLLHAIPPEPIR